MLVFTRLILFPSTSLVLFLGISLVLNIFFIKMWFHNRANNEAFLEMVQSFQMETTLLRKEVGNLKKDMINLTNKTWSTEILLEMVQSTIYLKEDSAL